MKLEKERKLNYKINVIKDNLDFRLLTVEFDAIDNSKIYAEFVVKKINSKGIILEIPDYEEVPSGMIKLMKYCTLGYGGATIHVRGDRGRSENRQPASIYFPFVTNNENDEIYYNYTYQDTIDLVNILKREFPDLEVNVIAKGQGAAIGIVASAVGRKVDRLFISNVQNFDFKNILDNNLDVGVYEGIREYARNYPEKEEYLLTRLEEIDVMQYCQQVDADVYFGYSKLDEKYNVINKKLETMFKRKNVIIFECEEENLHERMLEVWLMESMSAVTNK